MNIISLSPSVDLWICCTLCGNNFYTSTFKPADIMDNDLIVKWCSKECMKKEWDENRKDKKSDKKALCWVTSKEIQVEYGP